MESLVKCRKCNMHIKTSELKKDSMWNFLCKNCFDKKLEAIETLENLKKEEPIIKEEDKVTFYCEECNYRFKRKRNYLGKCPYCGKDSVRRIMTEKIIRGQDY